MSSKHDRSDQAPHLRVIHGGDDDDEEILEEGFHVIDDEGPLSDPWLKAGGDPTESDPPGVVIDTDPTVLEDDLSLPPLRDRHEETKPEIPQQALDARRRGSLPAPEDQATEPGPEEMATVPRAPMPEPRGAAATSAALPSAQLRVLEGPEVGSTFALAEPVVTVGRSSECQVTLRDLSMSRKHAEIRRAGRRAFEIRDLDSRNGTTVDGRPAKVWIAAAPGAILQIGDVRLRLEVEDLSEPTLLRPGGLAAGPLDPPLPPAPAPRPRSSAPTPGRPSPRAPAPRTPAPRSSPAPRDPSPPRSSPTPRAPPPRGPGSGTRGGAPGPTAPPAALGTLAKGALAVALGAGISWLFAWLVFFASFAPLRSRPPAPVAPGASPTAALGGGRAQATPPPAAPAPHKAAASASASAGALTAAQAAVSRQDWVVAVHEARLVAEAAPEHPAAAEILHSVREDVVGPRLDKARDQIAAHHPDAAEETLLSTLVIWPHEKTAESLLAKARADERAAQAPPPKAPPVAHHRTRHRRARHHRTRHVVRHTAPPPPAAPDDGGLLRKAREAFAEKHLHSAIAAADAAADLGGTKARKLDSDLHAFEASWNTASRTRDIATALASYTEALYRAKHVAPPSGGDYGMAIRRALGQAHYVAALQAQKAGRNQLALSHAQKALGYDPNNRGARSLLHALMR